ncbi:MAG TPA: transketolase [Phycisphaerales bacterium]|nr:transketolase [Phycisphaerales bacterium]
MSFDAVVHAQAIEIDRLSLEMCAAAGSGHPTSAASIGHIVTVLMFNTMRWDTDHPDYPTSDRLVLSEGHACPAVYAACAKLGVAYGKDPAKRKKLKVEDLKSLRMLSSELEGHPNPMEGFPFFDAATGSLGQGLSVAAGIAHAAKMDGLDKRVYCIVGDGEAREGQIAEAMDFIVDQKLRNCLVIFNCNEYGQADRVSIQQSPDVLIAKLEAAGFEALAIDGHSPSQIKKAFDTFIEGQGKPGKPFAVVAKTVKGWGSPSIQGGGWHGKPPTGDALKRAITELESRRVELTSALSNADQFTIQPPAEAAAPKEVGEIPTLGEAMKRQDMASLYQSGVLATRRAYGIALRELCKANPNIVALDADVSNSTFSEMVRKDPAISSRFVECKIAEQHMISAAVGFSAAGKVPFCSSFAKFLTRAYDQIEMAIYSGANLKIVGSHAGITLAADGPSQMSLPDVAWFRSFSTMKDHRGNPGCYVLQPSDAYAAYALTQVMAEYEGVCYMRTLRPETEFIYSDKHVFNLGGFEVLNEGRDILICAAGYMVGEANKAMEALDKAGISATVVDLYSLPFDQEGLLDLVSSNGGLVLTVEDNFGGGIGSAVADAILDAGDGFRLQQLHVKRIPKSARTPEELLDLCGISAAAIQKAAMGMLQVV